MMNYQKAVQMALQGKDEGYRFLYEQTYKSKYYLALQYMKNEDAAQDVLQNAYIKAFSKLDTLSSPESFPKWFGIIVGNTAKNALQKKNPLLFSKVEINDEDDPFVYEIEDETVDAQPELSYSRQETQQLVREMIDSLSEEQRIYILMFEIEGIPIKQISAALNCSENTVKSRLNYGRKKLKLKAEELQKKGYKLYGVLAVPFLLLLVRKEQSYFIKDSALTGLQQSLAQQLFSPSASSISQAAVSAGVKGLKHGFFHTITGKITAVVVTASLAGGSIYGVYNITQQNSGTSVSQPSSIVSDIASESGSESSVPSDQAVIETLYQKTLESIKNKEPCYEFLTDDEDMYFNMVPSSDDEDKDEIQYFLYDMNGDSIEELIVGKSCVVDVFYGYDCQIYSCRKSEEGYEVYRIEQVAVTEGYSRKDLITTDLYISEETHTVITQDIDRMPGDAYFSPLILEDDIISKGDSIFSHKIVSNPGTPEDPETTEFYNTHSIAPWITLTD